MDSATKKAKEAAAYKAAKKAKAAKQMRLGLIAAKKKLAGVQQVIAKNQMEHEAVEKAAAASAAQVAAKKKKEAAAFKAAKNTKQGKAAVRKIDIDGDGLVDRSEFAAAWDTKEDFDQFDSDSDGLLDANEMGKRWRTEAKRKKLAMGELEKKLVSAEEKAAAASATQVAVSEVSIIDEDALGELAEELFQLTEANSRLATAEKTMKAEMGELEKKLAAQGSTGGMEAELAAAQGSIDELEKKLAGAEGAAAAQLAAHEVEMGELEKKLAGVEEKAAAASAAHAVELGELEKKLAEAQVAPPATGSNNSNGAIKLKQPLPAFDEAAIARLREKLPQCYAMLMRPVT